MPPAMNISNRKLVTIDEWEEWEADEEWEGPIFLRTGWVPASAQQLQVLDLQQWIDLCA
jgi:hypothetical protein